MSEAKPKISRPVIYAGLATILVAGYLLTDESGVLRRGAPARTRVSKPLKLPEGFTEEDLAAKFERRQEPIKDSFSPIVARTKGGAEAALSPNAVPSVLTGGDPNWVYSGMAEVDSVSMGLLENRSTGEGVFVLHSQVWKQATVSSITPYSLVLVGANGKRYTMTVDESERQSTGMLAQNGFEPVSPNLRGPIGGGLEVVPERIPSSNGRPNRGAVSSNGSEIEERNAND